MTDEQKSERIQELQDEKRALLDEYGLFGGGTMVTLQFQAINEALERLGVNQDD